MGMAMWWSPIIGSYVNRKGFNKPKIIYAESELGRFRVLIAG
jgi:hypothetical protein